MASRWLGSVPMVTARIFGGKVGDGSKSGWKLLRKPRVGTALVDYYPPDPRESRIPHYEPPNFEQRRLSVERRKNKGKMPVKKGQGRRATKGKGKSS